MSRLLGQDLDTHPAVLEICHADHARLGFSLCLLMLLGSEAMEDTDMPARGIEARHLLAEKAAMGRGVLPAVEGDIVVNHLVEDGILHHLLGKVYARVDTQDEIGVVPAATEEPALLAKTDLAEEGLGIAQFDRDGRQLTVEILPVEVIELLPDIWNGSNQVMRRKTDYRCKGTQKRAHTQIKVHLSAMFLGLVICIWQEIGCVF